MSETKLSRGNMMILAIIFLAALVDGLDVSIVTVALPTMSDHFNVSVSDSSWVIFAYVVSLAAFLLPMGKMAKNGRVKKFMVLGTILFGTSSLACGLTNDFWMLVLFRLIQGLSAGMMSSVLPSMVVHMLPADRKGLGMSIMGASSGLALILGPVLGGIIAEVLDWRWLFFVNVPICVIMVIMSVKFMPKDGAADPAKDPTPLGGLAALLLIGSLLALLEDFGDPDFNTIGKTVCAVIAVIALPLLIISIRKDGAKAIIQPRVIRNREYMVVGAAFLLCTIVVAGGQYILPYMLQGYWGLSPFESGMYLAAVSVAMVSLVIPVGRMCDRFGCKWPSAMAAILRATFCGIMLIALDIDSPLFLLLPLAVFGASHAFSGTAQPTRMIHHATPGFEAESTNLMLVINYVASALGCVLFAMFFSLFSSGEMVDMTKDELAAGFIPVMWISIGLLATALVCTLSVKNKIVRAED